MSGQADVRELREVLASDTGMDLDHMLLTEIDEQGFLRTHSGISKDYFFFFTLQD